MANCHELDVEIANFDMEIKRMQDEREILVTLRAEALEAELTEAIAKVIALGGIASVRLPKKKNTSTTRRTGPKKFRDPATGAEWSGQGGAPNWIKGVDKQQFLNPDWVAVKRVKAIMPSVASCKDTAACDFALNFATGSTVEPLGSRIVAIGVDRSIESSTSTMDQPIANPPPRNSVGESSARQVVETVY